MLFEHLYDAAKVFGKRVARAQDINLFLYKELCLVSDRLLCVADVDDAPGKGDLLDCSTKGFRCSNRFNYDSRA